jgi:hypothetical protein
MDRMTDVRSSVMAAVMTAAAFGSGCSLFEAGFDASVEVDAAIDGNDPFYNECTQFDPNESQDFRDNRDKIQEGRISNIRVEVTNVNSNDHAATFGLGQIDVRRLPEAGPVDDQNCIIDGGEWITSIARWDPVPLVQGESFDLELDPLVIDQLHELVFDQGAPLEVRVQGYADQGPVDFEFEVRFDLEFTARLL